MLQSIERFLDGCKATADDITWKSPVMHLAARASLACTMAVLIALFLHADKPYWAAISAMTVMVANTGSSVKKSIQRFTGTLIGVVVALIVVMLSHQDTLIYYACLFFGCMGGIYYSTIDKERFYAWLLGYLAFCMVLLQPLASPSADAYITVAFYRCLEILIGIVSASLVQHLIFPKKASDTLNKNILSAAAECRQTLKHYHDCLKNPSLADVELKNPEFTALREKIDNLITQWSATCHETFFHPADFKRQGKLLRALANMLNLIVTSYRDMNDQRSPYWEVIENDADALFNKADRLLISLVLFFEGKASHQDVNKEVRQFKAQWIHLKRRFARLRRRNINMSYTSEQIDEVIAALSIIRLSVYEFEQALEVDSKKTQKPYQPKRISRYRKLIEYDTFYLKHALVGTLGILIGPLLWLILDLPGYSQIAISVAAVIGMNPESTRYKGFLRILGCLFGCILVVALLGINIQSTPFIMICLFCASLVCLFFHYGNDDVAYFGTQANVVLFIGMIYQFMPDESMATALQRLFGIVSGVCIVVLFQHFLWSYRPRDRVIHHMRQLQKTWYWALNSVIDSLVTDRHISLDACQALFQRVSNLRLLVKIKSNEEYEGHVHQLYLASRNTLRHIYTLNLIVMHMLHPNEVQKAIPGLNDMLNRVRDEATKSHTNIDNIQSSLAAFRGLVQECKIARIRIREDRLMADKTIAAAFDVYAFLYHLKAVCEAQITALENYQYLFEGEKVLQTQ